MYSIMYVTVWEYADVFNNLNQVYVTASMVGIMLLIELLLMKDMYSDHNTNVKLYVFGFILIIGSIYCIRKQFLINDKQFLMTMIPHHSMAILQTELLLQKDGSKEVKDLAKKINETQKNEISYMKRLLASDS